MEVILLLKYIVKTQPSGCLSFSAYMWYPEGSLCKGGEGHRIYPRISVCQVLAVGAGTVCATVWMNCGV